MGDIRTRKWQIVINNPEEKGYTHEVIKKTLSKLKSCIYWCMSDEIGLQEGTPHTHVYVCCDNAVRFSRMVLLFPYCHLEVCKGTSAQNRDYVFKIGKWENDQKEDTRVDGTQEEWGEIPVERQGKRNDIEDLYDMIKDGASAYEILESNPNYILQMDKIERVRQSVLEERYKNTFRDMHVTYIFGEPGVGKTRSIMEQYGYSNCYRVTDYSFPFDGYKGQDVLILDEFYGQIKIVDMLNILDGYPLELRCRYANKQAAFTKVYIISNIPLDEQYGEVQKRNYVSWSALCRRIHEVRIFKAGQITPDTMTIKEFYNGGFRPVMYAPDIFKD